MINAHWNILSQSDVDSWVRTLPKRIWKQEDDGSYWTEIYRRDRSNQRKKIIIRYRKFESKLQFAGQEISDIEYRVFVVHVEK